METGPVRTQGPKIFVKFGVCDAQKLSLFPKQFCGQAKMIRNPLINPCNLHEVR